MTPQDFAKTIKAKYPQYANIDDVTLARKMVEKYPAYASKVDFGDQAASGADRGFIEKAADAVKASPLGFVAPLGEAIGRSVYSIGEAVQQRSFAPIEMAAKQNSDDYSRIVGSAAASVALPASLAVAAPAGVLGAAAQYGGFGAVQAGAESLAQGNDTGQATIDAAKGGAFGAGAGTVFNLLGRLVTWGAGKTAPTTLSFTSGVPKEAIEANLKNPQVAKQGLTMSVAEVRDKAVGSLQSLYNDLGSEFETGLKEIVSTSGQTKAGMTFKQAGQGQAADFLKSASAMRDRLTDYGREFAREFRLSTKATPEGIQIGFDLSPITKPGEQRAVQDTFKTISTWKDFSAKGLQDLAERIGSLRNFESGAKTESSAIVSKIYNKITGAGGQADHGLISKYYPELHQLRTNYAQNRKTLDEIGSVLSFDKKDPKAVQGAITRLDNIFKENRDTYLNIIKQLGERSGVDYLSLLAGGEFQKILPGFVRGIGGGGALAASASFINPYLILLAPLFSPRAVGAITRNAPAAAKTTSTLTRAATTEAISKTVPQSPQSQ